jgi:hypothetical protein
LWRRTVMISRQTRRVPLVMAGGLVALSVSMMWLPTLCQQSKAAPPEHWGDCNSGRWAAIGRERLQGPQALAGTMYNLPGPDGAVGDDYAADGCATTTRWKRLKQFAARVCGDGCTGGCETPTDVGGSWLWMRSPEQERVVVAGLYNRYCIRCHGVDGRGVWDIPGVPDFTNTRWQLSRSDDQIARIIIEGRGAVMPLFRGTVTLEEAWAMARYLRTFVPGSEVSRPDVGRSEKAGQTLELLPAPQKTKSP